MMILDNTDDPFWKHVGLIYSQFEGMLLSLRCPGENTDALNFV